MNLKLLFQKTGYWKVKDDKKTKEDLGTVYTEFKGCLQRLIYKKSPN